MENKVISNQQKYFNYQEQHKRMKKALQYQFYLEAIAIEYAILEDRLEAALRHGGKWTEKDSEKHVSINQKINRVKKMAEEKKSPAHKYFSPELLDGIQAWKECRNMVAHALVKREMHTGALKAYAEQGEQYVKIMCNKGTFFRRATAKK